MKKACGKPKQSESPIWPDLLQVRKFYIQGRKFKCKSGQAISFWKDSWLDDMPICESFPMLFEVCSNPDLSVKECADMGWVISFKINLASILHLVWNSLADKLNNHEMGQGMDDFVWIWEKSGRFSTKSMYN